MTADALVGRLEALQSGGGSIHDMADLWKLLPSILRALKPAGDAVPSGWTRVPVEPTEAMLDAAQLPSKPREVWSAMLAAVPAEGKPG